MRLYQATPFLKNREGERSGRRDRERERGGGGGKEEIRKETD